MMRETEVIEQVMDEFEDIGMIAESAHGDKYDMLREVRSYMGELDFYKFLEYSCRCWGFTQAEYFDKD
mgnify:FL=1